MDMAIGQAGKHQPILSINHPCGPTDEFFGFLIAADKSNPAATNSDRLGPRMLRVCGVDLAVNNNQVGWRGGSRGDAHKNQESHCYCISSQSFCLHWRHRPFSESWWRIDPKNQGIAASRIQPGVFSAAFKIKTVSGL